MQLHTSAIHHSTQLSQAQQCSLHCLLDYSLSLGMQVAQMQAHLGQRIHQTKVPQLVAESSAVVLADVDQLQTQVQGVEDTIAMLRLGTHLCIALGSSMHSICCWCSMWLQHTANSMRGVKRGRHASIGTLRGTESS